MKIAISTDNGKIAEHFGRCPEFTIVEIQDNKVISKKIIPNPGHRTGFLPKFFKEQRVEAIIAGGAGWRAMTLFEEMGIKFIPANGSIDKAIDSFIKGKLKEGKGICQPGAGVGYGVKKEDGHRE